MLFYIPAHCFHKTFNERLNAASIIVKSLLIESDAWFLLLTLYLEQLSFFFLLI